MLHRPLFCSSRGRACTTQFTTLVSALEDLFYKYKVDVVLQAHVHNYERSLPRYRNETEPSYQSPRSENGIAALMCR